MTTTFPRKDDGKGWAWGLESGTPTKLWERFSPAYEAQAEALLAAIAAAGLTPVLDFGGSQDGEAALGLDDKGEAQVLFHLEDPKEAQRIAKGDMAALIEEARHA